MPDEFAVLGDLVARERRSDAPALRHAPTGRAYDYRRFCTTTWKVGNFLRNEGVRSGMHVAVAADAVPESVLSFYGAALLGATVEFGPDSVDRETRALVAPSGDLGAYDAGPRTREVGYGGEPPNPASAHFERDVWSENPTQPPDVVTYDDDLLAVANRTYTHEVVLGAAADVVAEYDLDADTTVAVRGRLTEPGVVAAGLVAPILARGEILLPDEEATGDVAVGPGPEDVVVEFDAVL